MASNVLSTKKYFDTNPEHFKNAVEEYPIMYKEAAERINKHIHGIVLDIGSGGVINYDTTKTRNLFLVDITTANKDRAKTAKSSKTGVTFVNSDIRKLGIRENTIDIVIMQHLLHHLADNTLKKTLQNLNDGCEEAERILKQGGKIIIVEGCVPQILDHMQRFFFQINKRLYKWFFSFPMVLQYSEATITKELKKTGFEIESVETIKDGDILPIFGLNLPRRWIPLKHKCIIAKKRR